MRKTTVTLLISSSLLLFTACGTEIQHVSPSDSVRKITPEIAGNCTFLGTGKVSHMTGFGEYDRVGNTYDIVRNDVMAKGGNAYVGNMITGNPYNTNMRYEIYKCR